MLYRMRKPFEINYGKDNISRGYSSGHQGLDIYSNGRINVVNIIANKFVPLNLAFLVTSK